MNIGDWVIRERRGLPHLVESVVAGDAITRCGRRMAEETPSGGHLVEAPYMSRICRRCAPISMQEDTES